MKATKMQQFGFYKNLSNVKRLRYIYYTVYIMRDIFTNMPVLLDSYRRYNTLFMTDSHKEGT